MHIKGMTDKKTLSSRSGMPKLGELRKGSPKKKITKKGRDGKPYEQEIQGDDLPYFRFTSTNKRLEKSFLAAFSKGAGKGPGEGPENAIPFFLPYDDLEKSFPAAMSYFKGGSEYVRCDREKIHSERLTSPSGGPWENIVGVKVGTDNVGKPSTKWVDYPESKRPECRWPNCALGKKGFEECKGKGALKIEIQELGEYGIVTVLLGAKNDIPHVAGLLFEIAEKAESKGIGLSQVPLLLWRADRSISTPNFRDMSSRQRVDKSLVEVGINIELWKAMFEQRSQMALASVSGGQAALAGGGRLRLAASDRADEFGEKVNTDFKTSERWANIKMAFDKCRSVEAIQATHARANACVDDGRLPHTALNSIAVLAQNAKQRLLDSDVQPLPDIIDAEVVVEPSVLERFEAIALNTGYEMSEVEAIAKRLNMQVDDISQWSEAECQALRNWLYSRCAVAVKAMESTDAATAEYQGLLTDKLLDQADDQSVWSAWAAVL